MQKYYIFSEINYNFLRQRHQILADNLSEHYEVHFIERIPSRIPEDIHRRVFSMVFKKLFKRKDRVLKSNLNICISRSHMLPSLYFIFSLYNILRVKWILRGSKPGDIVHVFANSPVIARVAKSKRCFVVFDIVHNWWSFPSHNEKQRRNLKDMILLSDLISSDSEETLTLAKLECEHVKKRYLHLPPGVDRDWIDAGLQRLGVTSKKFRVAFFGNLRANSDLKIFRKLLNISAIDIVIYGELDQSLNKPDYTLLKRFYAGNFPVPDLISKLKRADAVLLPYDTSNFSSSIFPAKYFEVMALGKPIISDSEMVHLPMWKKFIWTTEDLSQMGWEQLLKEHYSFRHHHQVELARGNSWQNRVIELRGEINENL